MIFWILIALSVVIIGWTFAATLSDAYNGLGFSLLCGAMSAVACAFVGGLIFVACGTRIPYGHEVVKDDTYKLKAIGNSSALEGRTFFLGGGYIKDKRVLNFISQRDGGAIRVEQAEAEDAAIYEGSKDATVRIKHIDAVNGWVSPWPLGSGDEYEFRIPTGSVVESYTLDNK